MSQAYSDPTRADDPHALPDVEVFYLTSLETATLIDGDGTPGWYWWPCFPGCLPDADPTGPFDSYDEARDDSLTGNNSGYKL
jgi:hypothetical protein